MTLIDVRVVEIIDESPSVKSIRLARVDGRPLGVYQAGAHVDVVGPTAITRQYSLCSRPEDPESYTVAVKRETASRGGSASLHELRVGDVLKISEPRNLLGIVPDASHHLLVAAGIGITPMLSMARYIDVHEGNFDLHYFARSEQEAPFLDLLRDRCPQKLHAHLGCSRDAQDDLIAEAVRTLPDGAHLYVCGPEGFMDKVRRIAGEQLPENRIHQEHFHASQQPDTATDTAFTVELEETEYEVPAGTSIVEALRAGGIDIDTSCQEGICGTCIMTVIEGEPDHRDTVLTAAEKQAGEQIATCVSRSKSPRLILDWY